MASAAISNNGVLTVNPTYPNQFDTAADVAALATWLSTNCPSLLSQGVLDNWEYKWQLATGVSGLMHAMNYGMDSSPAFIYTGIDSLDASVETAPATAGANMSYNIWNANKNSRSLYLGGDITAVDGLSHAKGVAEFAGTACWHTVWSNGVNTDMGANQGVLNGVVNAMCTYNGKFYVAGTMTSVGNNNNPTTVASIACFDGYNWTALGSGVAGGSVSALCVYGGKLIIGGSFTSAGGVAHTAKLATWDGSNWASLDGSSDFTGTVKALYVSAAYSNKLIIGSTPALIAGKFRVNSWDGATLAVIGGTDASNSVNAICDYNNSLFICGQFETIDGSTVKRIARWNGSNWVKVGTTGLTGALANNGSYAALALAIAPSGNLVVGGKFTDADSVSGTQYLAQWNNVAWTACGTGILTTNNYAQCLCTNGTKLYIGTAAAGKTSGTDVGDYLISYNGTSLAAVGTGSGITATGSGILALGTFYYHWACLTLVKAFVGACVCKGIYARPVGGTSPGPNVNLDSLCEIYDTRSTITGFQNGWAAMFLPYNRWMENGSGVPQSFQKIKDANDAGHITTSKSGSTYSFTADNGFVGKTFSGTDGNCAAITTGISIPWWCGYSGDSGGVGDKKLLYHNTISFKYLNNHSSPSEDYTPNWNDGSGRATVAMDAGSVTYPIVQLKVTGVGVEPGEVILTYDSDLNSANLGGGIDHYEISENGGTSYTQTDFDEGYLVWLPAGGGTSARTLLFRAIMGSGATSPAVQIAYTVGGGVDQIIGDFTQQGFRGL